MVHGATVSATGDSGWFVAMSEAGKQIRFALHDELGRVRAHRSSRPPLCTPPKLKSEWVVAMDRAGSVESEDRTGRAPPPPLPYEPKRWISTTIVLLLLAIALVFAFLVESLRADQYTLSFVTGGLPVSDTEVLANHQRLVRDCTLLVILTVAVAVLWAIWQYRAHANVRALVSGARFRPLWGLASWVIPGANLVLAPLAMRELWRASNPDEEDWRRARTTPLLWLWWLLILAGLSLAVWSLLPVVGGGVTTSDLFIRDHRAVIAGGLGIPAAVAAALLFGLLQGRMVLKEDRVRLGAWKAWSER